MTVLRPRRAVATAAAVAVAVTGFLAAPALTPAAGASPGAAPSRAAAAPSAQGTPSTGTAGTVTLENSFVSDQGWVKPDAGTPEEDGTYPARLILTNTGAAAPASVALTAPEGTTVLSVRGPGTHEATGDGATWSVTVPAGTADAPGRATLIVEQQADSLEENPELVWRDLSTTAVLTVGSTSTDAVFSHGPKVIPPGETYETAKYGDRPFPVVPVSYTDFEYRAHDRSLDQVINDPGYEGSTFNLFQEMSLGQLYPQGDVPSTGKGTVPYTAGEAAGYDFTPRAVPGDTCTGGLTYADSPVSPIGTQLYPNRIDGDVYQLPGNRAFYGADSGGTAIAGPGQIDSGCGSPGKLVRDAAVISDPDIDFSDFDTDKDGVVDFFMAVFQGCGGNGASQVSPAVCEYDDEVPGDNVWPHSSSLEFYYTDPETGLPGYTTDDQLKDLEGRPLWYTDSTYSQMTTDDKGDALKVFVRIGPYNVNPETAIDKASVISHEYGHSLGLPDFYSSDGTRETYGDWNLMATDKSQNMDVFSRQELGWVVPRVLEPGTSPTVTDWTDSKQDIDEITWQTPDGEPYTLEEGADGRVQNSEAYVAKLPGRQLLDPAVFDTGDKASKTHAWWSQSGNDFGCAPEGGHNLDLYVPELATADPASTVKLEFKSLWDIEWDFDYGYVLTTTNRGESYTSHPSAKGYTTSNTGVGQGNPNQNACQAKYDNGITGTSGSYDAGTQLVDRNPAAPNYPEPVFLGDEYDVSDLAGEADGALRFSYATDPGLARPGWFIDDLKITLTEPGKAPREVLATNLEDSGGPDDTRVYNGGCQDKLMTARKCTVGWSYVAAGAESPADHAYYLEMRDRSGFDFDGKGQIDRDPIDFDPGLSVVYTDEAHGYGNNGVPDPPAQSPLDSQPVPGEQAPDLSDAAWTDADGDSTFSDSGDGHTDNYQDPESADTFWHFKYNCLGFDVTSMSGETFDATKPEPASDGDLTGTVDFDLGTGCGDFDYGYGDTPDPGPNTAPTADAAADPTTASTGEEITFDASGSTDAETPAELDYSWNFGDSGTDKDASGESVKHTYDEPGTYTVTVTVTDPRGATDTDSVDVTVTSPAGGDTTDPTARMSVSPQKPISRRPVTFSAKGSSDDTSDADDLTYAWDFGNGGSTVDATGETVRTSFRSVGPRTVTLTVTDEAGNSTTLTRRVTVHRLVSCGADRVTLRGSWRSVRGRGADGNRYCDNLGRGRGTDVATMRFTGPSISLIRGASRRGGIAKVYIDGRRVSGLSFRNDSRAVRFSTKTWSRLGSGTHTIRIVVQSRQAYLDAFLLER